MIRSLGAAAALAAATFATPAAAEMSVATFLAKVNALKAKGVGALFSPDVAVIKRETQAAVQAMKAEREARKVAGKPPLYCPPATAAKTRMKAGEFLAAMEAIPPAERSMSLKAGLTRVMTRRYPCR